MTAQAVCPLYITVQAVCLSKVVAAFKKAVNPSREVVDQGSCGLDFANFLGDTSPFFPGILLSIKPSELQGNSCFLKRTMVEKNAE